MHLDDLETQLLAAAKDLMQVGGAFDAAPDDRLGGRRGRAWVAEGRRKGGAEVPAYANFVALAHLSTAKPSAATAMTRRYVAAR